MFIYRFQISLRLFIKILASLLVLSSLGLVIYLSIPNQSLAYVRHVDSNLEPTTQTSNLKENLKTIPEPTKISLTTSFAGDVFLGRGVRDWALASELKYQYPFSQLSTIPRSEGEFWIANLECPVTDSTITQYQEEKLLKFNCQPDFLPELKKHFSVMSLANNHTDNMQEVDGYRQTREYLAQNSIAYFGHYDNSELASLCNLYTFPVNMEFASAKEAEEYKRILALPETIQASQYSSSINHKSLFPVALCGYHNVFKLPTESELAVIETYARYFPTIIMPHQGAEYGSKADNFQKTYFRRMVDLGADMVMGGHTHSIHNTEVYKDRLIVYSLGNFIFDQQFNQAVTTGLMVKVNWDLNSEILSSYHQLMQDMRVYELLNKDNLILDPELLYQKISNYQNSLNLQKPAISKTYSAVITDSDNRITRLAGEGKANLGLNRANWAETIQILNSQKN